MLENKKLDNIFKEIWELPTEDLEILWQWFDEHTIVGGVIVETSNNNPGEKWNCILCGKKLSDNKSQPCRYCGQSLCESCVEKHEKTHSEYEPI